MQLITVGHGEEIVTGVGKAVADLGLLNGAIVSLIGAVTEATISNMPAGDEHDDVLSTYRQPMEMSGTGEIVNGRIHLHVVLSREGDQAIAGHLHRAVVGAWFGHAYVIGL